MLDDRWSAHHEPRAGRSPVGRTQSFVGLHSPDLVVSKTSARVGGLGVQARECALTRRRALRAMRCGRSRRGAVARSVGGIRYTRSAWMCPRPSLGKRDLHPVCHPEELHDGARVVGPEVLNDDEGDPLVVGMAPTRCSGARDTRRRGPRTRSHRASGNRAIRVAHASNAVPLRAACRPRDADATACAWELFPARGLPNARSALHSRALALGKAFFRVPYPEPRAWT